MGNNGDDATEDEDEEGIDSNSCRYQVGHSFFSHINFDKI